jgi:hypothetical protein
MARDAGSIDAVDAHVRPRVAPAAASTGDAPRGMGVSESHSAEASYRLWAHAQNFFRRFDTFFKRGRIQTREWLISASFSVGLR